jgi:hypothetical protein
LHDARRQLARALGEPLVDDDAIADDASGRMGAPT